MSAWGDSWAYAWGDSWGATQVVAPGRFPRNGSKPSYRPALQSFARAEDSETNRTITAATIRQDAQPNIRVTVDPMERATDKITERHEPKANNRTQH